MEMCDSLVIGGAQHWGGGDDIFGICIVNGLQDSELAFEGGIAVDNPISPARSSPTVTV